MEIKDIFTDNNDESLLMNLVERITSKPDFDIHKLSDTERNLVAVVTAQALIDNGGFRYFFESHIQDSADYTLFVDAYQTVGAEDSAQVIDQALSLFPEKKPPSDYHERRRLLDRIFTEGEGTAKSLENQILGVESNYTKAAAYARANQDKFS